MHHYIHSMIREVLYNPYAPLSADSWNQTLRKSKIFHQSWARKCIRTKYDSYFEDQITGNKEEWKKGEDLMMQNVVTLKLYTDFDDLQWAMKQCFRLEITDIDENEGEIKDQTEAMQLLEARLEAFYHWRSALMVVLNKFATRWRDIPIDALYCGINEKMGISSTAAFSFYGPLSTTASYHVAKGFATEKGMVLKIASRFPRLDYCNALDTSLFSDYPEEQEWLVGHMYVRILEVITKEFDIRQLPIASRKRHSFFVIQLFKEQIFSMDPQSAIHLARALAVNRGECCKNKKKYIEKYGEMEYPSIQGDSEEKKQQWHLFLAFWHLREHIDDKQERRRTIRQFCRQHGYDDCPRAQNEIRQLEKVWMTKFHQIRETPNKRQCVKFDRISDILKRFFMEQIEERDIRTGKRRWIISFEEILTVYPNVEELHFMNEYRFDDGVLQRLIKQIKREDNPLRKVVFLYFDYTECDEMGKPINCGTFMDPDHLDSELVQRLNDLKLGINHSRKGDAGYKVTIEVLSRFR